MPFSFSFILVVLLIPYVFLQEYDVDQDLVDYYVDFIASRAANAQNFELPTDARMYEPKYKTIQDYGEFDFIVVGGGSTGCIIANRLSEVQEWSVLLLEAGTFPGQDFTRIPNLMITNFQTKYNWGYQSTPQKYGCLGNNESRCPLPRGKGFGGTSLLNAMMYARGNKLDYKKWADLLGDSSYEYENLLPYFMKTENFNQTFPEAPIDWKYHGTNGPLHVTQSYSPSDIQEAIFEGSKKLGINFTDYNGENQVGTSIIQYYLNNGQRDDPGLAFISTAAKRTNLKVLDESYVIKLNISTDNKRINGVIFSRDNKTFIARNRKEVILSAGVIGSPQILLLSGIGPEDHLKSFGIPVIENLPVGETLHDHVLNTLIFSSNISPPSKSIEELVKEFLRGKGPLTSAITSNTVSWLTIPGGRNEECPDIELLFTKNDQLDFTYPEVPNPLGGALLLLHPISKGSFRLKSADPFEYPLINLNLLGDNADLELLYKAFQIVLQLTETEPFRKLNISLVPIELDECNIHPPLSKEFWFCYLRRTISSGQHMISTCMTGTTPRNGVVDKQLKVFGVKDIRVADASVIPFPFAHNPVATCAVIAEKISDQIKKEYLKDPK